MGLLDGGEANVGVQAEAVVQVRGATLGLPDDVEVWQAAQAVVLVLVVVQVVPKHLPEVIENDAEALGVERVGVGGVGIRGRVPAVLLVPTRVLAVWKEFVRNYRKHLQHKEQQFQSRQQAINFSYLALTFLSMVRQQKH